MKKKTSVLFVLLLSVSILAACGNVDSSKVIPEADAGIVTDMQVNEVGKRVAIIPMSFDEGEEVENPYYKRAVDKNGDSVYAVRKAEDKKVEYLPMSSTVMYTTEEDDCYYEKYKLVYKMDGESVTSEQYQLYVTAVTPTGTGD